MRPIACLATAMAFIAAAPALAQTPRPGIVRGAIVSVDGANVVVIPAQLSDIKPGVFVGAAAMPGPDGTLAAMEVHIFPEAARGTGEGFRPFDLAPGSTMTNANISAMIDSVSGPKLTLTYKGGEQTVVVDKSTPIVTFAPGEAADLKPGASVDIFGAAKAADGSYEAGRFVVGRNGTKVPM
jgi:hypothetical protein